jgi:hypothetical protein
LQRRCRLRRISGEQHTVPPQDASSMGSQWLLLGVLYSAGGLFGAAAGLESVVGMPGVENVDLTQVAGHLEFLATMGEVMGALGVGEKKHVKKRCMVVVKMR